MCLCVFVCDVFINVCRRRHRGEALKLRVSAGFWLFFRREKEKKKKEEEEEKGGKK